MTRRQIKEHAMKRQEFVGLVDEILDVTGWSQAELGRRVGVHEATVSRWRDDRTPNGPTVAMLKLVLAQAKAGEFKQLVASA